MSLVQMTLRRLQLQVLCQRDPFRPRIFGVGLSKTATTTLCDALRLLEFNTIHYGPVARIETDTAHLQWPWWLEDVDAMADLPVAAVFRQLAERFPTSTFILTTRDEEAWLSSARKHFNAEAFAKALQLPHFQKGLKLNKYMYDDNVFNEDKFRAAFRKHNSHVRSYFGSDPRFHEMDICAGDGWDRLCDIVNRPVPDISFPKSNVRARA
jgi:hypothetical protein